MHTDSHPCNAHCVYVGRISEGGLCRRRQALERHIISYESPAVQVCAGGALGTIHPHTTIYANTD